MIWPLATSRFHWVLRVPSRLLRTTGALIPGEATPRTKLVGCGLLTWPVNWITYLDIGDSPLGCAVRLRPGPRARAVPGPVRRDFPRETGLARGGAARHPARIRALRPRRRGVHRRQARPSRPPCRGPRRHPVSRRGRRDSDRGAGEAAALPPVRRDPAAGLGPQGEGGRAGRRRHPPRPPAVGGGGKVPGGPVFPAQGARSEAAAAARAPGGRPAAGRPLPAPLLAAGRGAAALDAAGRSSLSGAHRRGPERGPGGRGGRRGAALPRRVDGPLSRQRLARRPRGGAPPQLSAEAAGAPSSGAGRSPGGGVMQALLCSTCGTANSELNIHCAACGAALPTSSSATQPEAGLSQPAKDPFAAGQQVSHYRLLRPLGRGGMGIVYLALDVELGREVALKFLHRRQEVRPADEARFRREARIAASLDHPGIGTIYEVGEHAGLRFLAMAFYDGTTVARLLASRPDRRLAVSEVAAIAGQLASALAAAHAAGIVHRDLKPENVMVLPDGRVKLLDFGLARQVDAGGVTEEGVVVGTAAYMAPEQLRGQRTSTAVDLWALGVVLYQMLTGRQPFAGERAGMVHSILHEHPPPLREARPDVPAALERVVSRCLEKEPADRWPAAADILAELQAAGLWGSATGTVVIPYRRRPWRRWVVAATAAAGLLAAAVFSFLWTRKPALPVYVAVLQPEIAGSLDAEDRARVAANLQATLLRTVASL